MSIGAPIGVTVARLSLAAISLQILSGAETLMSLGSLESQYYATINSLNHEKLSLVLLTCLLVGFNGVRKPINIRSLI